MAIIKVISIIIKLKEIITLMKKGDNMKNLMKKLGGTGDQNGNILVQLTLGSAPPPNKNELLYFEPVKVFWQAFSHYSIELNLQTVFFA